MQLMMIGTQVVLISISNGFVGLDIQHQPLGS